MPGKIEYFQRAADIGQYILLEGSKNGCWIESRLESSIEKGPNPYCGVNPDDGSLLLEMNCGVPTKFHTPLGQFMFGGFGIGDFTELMKELKIKLGLVEIVPEKVNKFGCFGPVYAITKDLNGVPFPMPTLPRAGITLNYFASKTEWDQIKATIVVKTEENEESATLRAC